jgi:periplasmic copper chaperone A
MSITIKTIAAIALWTCAGSSFSHITLEQQSADINTTTKAVLRVGHGCEGMPTAALRVQLPEGFSGAKPMPKAGWTLTTVRSKLAKPYDDHGKSITEDVSEITWTANSKEVYLTDGQYDEFVLRGKTPATAGAIWFKVTQLCKEGDKTGQNPWVDIPATGISTKGMKFPAALLNVTEPAAAATTAAKSTEHKH